MIIVPIDVKCRFCTYTFCCSDCRFLHEKSEHENRLNLLIREEYLQSICHMCHGEQLPYNINEKLPEDLRQHIVETHMPLKCNKCMRIFENISDLEEIGKCCAMKPNEMLPRVEISDENIGSNIIVRKARKNKLLTYQTDFNENEEEEALTPLTKINLRWRRKSMEFSLKIDEGMQKKDSNDDETPETLAPKRTTSTPMPIISGIFDSLSSIQYSSINSVSSSSENDYSPPVPSQKMPPPILTPKSIKKNASQNKSRAKVHAHNTPLRQLMTKSIQRAIATHGHYKNINLQQRKMTFDSSGSSNEPTVSLLKFKDNESDMQSPIEAQTKAEGVKFEEIQIIYQNHEYHSENSSTSSSIMTSYKSCFTENTTTPKMSSNNLLKKTISFETPATVEKTLGLLVPKKTRIKSSNNFDEDDDDESDNDIFYTPKSTPVRRLSTPELTDRRYASIKPPPKNFWNMVTSAVGNFVGAGSSKTENAESLNENWLQKPKVMLKAATDYFAKNNDKPSYEAECDDDLHAQKRRRPNSTEKLEVVCAQVKSPASKRRRIQGRKPIQRMRSFT